MSRVDILLLVVHLLDQGYSDNAAVNLVTSCDEGSATDQDAIKTLLWRATVKRPTDLVLGDIHSFIVSKRRLDEIYRARAITPLEIGSLVSAMPCLYSPSHQRDTVVAKVERLAALCAPCAERRLAS